MQCEFESRRRQESSSLLRFGIELVPDRPVFELVEWDKAAEDAGFDNIWVTDHYNNRNPWCTLTTIALNTRRVLLGPGVTNPYHTSPALSAAAAATLNEISGGRAVIGLGAGDRVTLATLGVQWRLPVSTVVEAIQVVRTLTRGDKCHLNGKVFNLRGAKLDVVRKSPVLDSEGRPITVDGKTVKAAPRIPIYAGAQGPQMLEKTAAVADGILINASHPRDFRMALASIKKGARRAGRSMDELDIGAYTAMSIADSYGEAMQGQTRMVVAYIVAGSPELILRRHGIDAEAAEKIRSMLAQGRFGEAQGLVDDNMVDAFAIVGSSHDCIQRIDELVREGVTNFIAGSPIGPDKNRAIRKIGGEIIAHYRGVRT
ncbi:MAG: 5,10-methylenetetrahydromethanopterin reductase [Candidatus Thorarchaeota archaeon]|nr:5,10-methylenetetrahydromethanopterin reductase [Candidatus Thorarchaeota archaeon]